MFSFRRALINLAGHRCLITNRKGRICAALGPVPLGGSLRVAQPRTVTEIEFQLLGLKFSNGGKDEQAFI